MDEVLGQGTNQASIYTRDGRTRLLDLPASSIEWPRTLCEVSRATVSVAAADITGNLGRIAPWAHTLVVHRNEERVWEGPVRKVSQVRTGLTLAASDVAGWMERRRIRQRRRSTGSPVITEMEWTIEEAFAPDDPHVTMYARTLGGIDLGATVERDVAPSSAYHSDDLASLVSAGGRWTTLGRSIIIWPETFNIGSTRTLLPENHLTADVEVAEDGDDLATAVATRNDDGVMGYAGAVGVDSFYGLVDTLASVPGHAKPAALTARAESLYRRSYPGRVIIDMPTDTALRPDAPFPMRNLVPGMLVPVQTTTATSRKVRATMMLTGVKVTQQAKAAEQVSITLVPPSEAVA